MLETLILLCIKAATAAMVVEVKKEAVRKPLEAAVEIFAGWDKDGKLQLDKWVRIAEGAVDIETAVEDALNLGKSKGAERVWDTLQVATALVSTGRSFSNIMNESQPMEALRRSVRVQPAMIQPTKFPTLDRGRMVRILREPVNKPPVNRRKKVARKIQRQSQPTITQVSMTTRKKRQPYDMY